MLLQALLVSLLLIPVATARRFRNIASNPTRYGLHYRRTPSRTNSAWLQTLEDSLSEPMPFLSAVDWPWATHGQPGVAVADFDGGKFAFIFRPQLFVLQNSRAQLTS